MQPDNNIKISLFDEENESIVWMNLNDAVKRITAYELPGLFEMEAAKALAVAIRTKIAKRLKMFDGQGCENCREADICTSMQGCGFISSIKLLKDVMGEGFDDKYKIACDAADGTSGIIITCGGKPVEAEYHLACGGGTENSEEVLENRVIYLRKVLCRYCSTSPVWENCVEVPVKELQEKLGIRILEGSSTTGPEIEGVIEDIERDETGRIRGIKIGGKYFSGVEAKNLLGLTSSRFGWSPTAIRFIVRGSGSGLGMCLYGADAMARCGKSVDEILNYYYTSINIENMEEIEEGAPLKGRTFIIDPGHGGPGEDDESGPAGLKEKDVNLSIAKKLSECLLKDGAKVILTREGDEIVPLPVRIEIINNIRPNFLISIHQNSFLSPGVSGTEVYYYQGDAEGEKIGNMILKNIVNFLGTINRGSRRADFYILRESKVSSVVVECMYITNPDEEEKLKDDVVKEKIAKAIYRGVLEYYGI